MAKYTLEKFGYDVKIRTNCAHVRWQLAQSRCTAPENEACSLVRDLINLAHTHGFLDDMQYVIEQTIADRRVGE